MRARVLLGVVPLVLAARAGSAEACQRPTDPGGYAGYDYGTAPVSSFDGKNVRIWYTTTGTHAVNPTTTRADSVPDNVATAATVADAALDGYAAMGFKAPVSDGGSGTDCGGSPALDIYLLHFTGADGDTATEDCTTVGKAQQCASFGQVEARLESIYGSFELGSHVVIAHELFHSVQDAYDTKLDHFWAEGTAQWAAKRLDPAETDLESFLPSFFKNAGQSIDISTGGVVADFLYASAIWPVFLTQYVGPNAVRGGLEQEATLGPPSMSAIDASLLTSGSSLVDVYPTFMAWNAATGSRAGTGGYTSAKSYPALTLQAFPDTGTASAIATGFSSFFYSFDFGGAQMQLTLTGDATRVGARTFPLVGGQAQLDQLAPLPATVTGAGVVVVAGVSSKKTDAPFTLTAAPPGAEPVPDAGDDGGSGGDASAPNGDGGGGGGGCDVSPAQTGPSWMAAIALLSAFFFARKRRHACAR